VENFVHDRVIPRLKREHRKTYLKRDILSETEFLTQCETGDIFLVRKMRFSMFSIFESHNALDMCFLIYREKDKIFLCAQCEIGIKEIPFEEFKERFEGSIELYIV
jgi:hypothetical protein